MGSDGPLKSGCKSVREETTLGVAAPFASAVENRIAPCYQSDPLAASTASTDAMNGGTAMDDRFDRRELLLHLGDILEALNC
jgi:hypothetical protein